VGYATSACELSEWQDPTRIDTLATAYAETGDFEQAIHFITMAVNLPDLSERNRKGYQERLALFAQKRTYHAPSHKLTSR